ncbi:MAG: peptidoglycan DD-metalloendopeptidase family protein [Anaerolineae bacterium]
MMTSFSSRLPASAPVAQQLPLTPPARLAIYYGWPSLVNNAGGDLGAATAAFAQFDVVVLGDGLEHATHGDHANTATLIANLNARGVSVFGYVDLGITTHNLDIGTLETYVDEWAGMGVAGIFLDDAGHDFGVDRARLTSAVDYVHSLGLQAFVNAWNPDDVLADDPPGSPTPLGSGDWYLADGHPVSNGQFSDLAAWWSKSQSLATYRDQTGARIAVISTGDDSQDGWTNSPAFRQTLWATFLFGFDAFGFTNRTFSATGSGANRLRPLPALATDPGAWFTGPPTGPSGSPPTYSRPTDKGTILVWGDSNSGGGAFRGGDCDTTALGDRIWPTCSATPPAQSSPFGPRQKASEGYRYDWHRGVDIPLPLGSPIYAAADGVVRVAGDDPNYSNPLVQLRHGASAPYFYSEYLHVSDVVVSAGDLVTVGDLVGYSGSSASGFEHLHLEFREDGLYQDSNRNPWEYLPYSDRAPALPTLQGANLAAPSGALLLLQVDTPADQLDLDGMDLNWGSDSVQLSFDAINATTPRDWPQALDNPLVALGGAVEACLFPGSFGATSTEASYRFAFRGLDAGSSAGSAAVRDVNGSGSSVPLSPTPAPLVLSSPVQHAEAPPGTSVVFAHTLQNTGSQPLTLALAADSSQNSALVLSHADLILPPGESQIVTMTLGLSADLPPGAGDCVVLEVDAGAGTSTIAVDSVTISLDAPGSTSYISPTQGGQISSPDGRVQVAVPAGSISTTTTMTLTEQAATTQSMGDLLFAGTSFKLEAAQAAGDPVTAFDQPYTITIHYGDADWQTAGIWPEAGLNLAYWDADTSAWINLLPCAGCSLDTTNNVLVAMLDHLTEFALVGGVLVSDVDGNCTVDVLDAQAVAGRWQARLDEPNYVPLCDVNADGVINIVDIGIVTAAWGTQCQ